MSFCILTASYSAQRVSSLLGKIMEKGKLPGDMKFMNAAKILIPQIEKVNANMFLISNSLIGTFS